MQWQPPGAAGLSAERTELLRGSHVPVCASDSHQALRSEVLGENAQPLVPLHINAGAPGF